MENECNICKKETTRLYLRYMMLCTRCKDSYSDISILKIIDQLINKIKGRDKKKYVDYIKSNLEMLSNLKRYSADEIKARRILAKKRYHHSSAGREALHRAGKKYRQTEKGKEALKRATIKFNKKR